MIPTSLFKRFNDTMNLVLSVLVEDISKKCSRTREHMIEQIECARQFFTSNKNQLSAKASFAMAPLPFFDATKSSNKVGQAWNMIKNFTLSISQLSDQNKERKNALRQLRNLGG
jgi:hypothetical protein